MKISTKGLKFHAPLTDKFLQTSIFASDVSAAHNHANKSIGTPTFSPSGMDLDGVTESLQFPATGIFNTSNTITIAFRFTPDFAADADNTDFIWDTTNLTRYGMIKLDDAGANILRCSMATTFTIFFEIALATYGPFWNVDVENTMIMTGDDTTEIAEVYLNGVQIHSDTVQAFTQQDPATLYLGSRFSEGTFGFDGELRDFMIFNRIWTAAERAIFDSGGEGLGGPQKGSSLQKGLKFHVPLTDKFLQTSVLASDISANHNHATTDNGTATYSSTGYECDGSTDNLEFPSTGVFNTTEITIAFRFTPDFETSDDVQRVFFDATTSSRYFVFKRNNANSNVLQIELGNTVIESIAEAAYTGAWNTNQENTMIITGDDANNLTNIYLNGTQILTNDATTWANTNPATLFIGSTNSDTLHYDGEIRDFMVWNRLLTAAERAEFDAGSNGANQKVSSLYKGMNFHAPLTDKFLQTSVLASDVSAAHNHATTANGTPTYSSTGMELDGSTDALQFTLNGAMDLGTITIAFRFTPDFSPTDDAIRYFFSTQAAQRYDLAIFDNASSNIIRVNLGQTVIADIAEATYSPFWNVDQENTFIISGTSGATNVFLNGAQIVTNDTTAWTANTPATLFIGAFQDSTSFFDGEIRDFVVWDRILTAAERSEYENSKSLLI